MSEAPFSIDAFHRGRFHVVQPRKGGHRSGIDAMLVAACVPEGFAGHAVDLGAGAGAAGLAVVSRLPGARVLLVERDPLMADCARRSLALPANAGLAGRAAVLEADVTLKGDERREAGLQDDAFDFAILNPPFNDARDRQTPDALRQTAHVMNDGLFDAWMRTVTAIVKPGGGFALIARPENLLDILEAATGRFGGLIVKPVHARDGEAAIRVLVKGTKGSRARLELHAGHVLHAAGRDAFLPEADAVNNGMTALL